MALTENEIKVIIAAEVRKAGFDKAKKATSGLENSFKKLGKTIVSVFAVREIIRFGRASVNAFAEAEKEAAQLRATLTGINLEFATPVVDDYLDKLELLTGRTGNELVPAFNSLSQATQDITNAQSLLNLALDVSAATGKDLTSVSTALQRAYKGETTAIARLRLGLTTAELKGKKFADVVEELERRFGGASKRNAETFASSIDRLRRSVEQAQEAIGKGFVMGLQNSGRSIEETQDKIIELGENLGEIAAGMTNLAISIGDFFDGLANNRGIKIVLGAFELLTRYGGAMVTGELKPSFKSNEAQQRADQQRKNEVAARNELRVRNQILRQEKINNQNRKRISDEEKKRARELLAQKRAATIFDMENIQIVAALQGKIDGEQRMRLVTLLALNTDNIKAAEKLADVVVRLNAPALESLGVIIKAGDSIDDVVRKLIGAQARLAGLQLQAEDFPELDNPFDPWEETLKRIMLLLDQLEAKQKKQPTMQQEVPAPQLTQKNNFGGGGGADSNTSSLSSQANKLATERLEALQKFYESERLATSGMGGVSRGEYAGSGQYRGNVGSGMGGVARGEYSPSVTVNVAGNVVTENDLVRRITDSLYGQQKSGKQVVYRSTDL